MADGSNLDQLISLVIQVLTSVLSFVAPLIQAGLLALFF